MKENNFPIKYALQPIYETIDMDEEILFYVISKCYLVVDNIKYYSDGTNIHYYEVVFPYKEEFITLLNNNGIKRKPQFDYKKTCYNQDYTYALYDSYDEAIEDRLIANKEEIGKFLATIPYESELYQRRELLIKEKIFSIQKIEEILDENTRDLIINNNIKILRK